MQQTTPKSIIMASNGTPTHKSFVFDWASLIQGVLAAGVLSITGFLIKMNSTIAVIQEQKIQEQRFHDEMKQQVNQINLDIRDLRDRAIRAEKPVTN